MDQKEFDEVAKLPGGIRYEYFVKKVAMYDEVWGLYDEGWAMPVDDDGDRLVLLWPRREFAAGYAKENLPGFVPECIGLGEFVDEWLPKMRDEGTKPAIFNNGTDVVVLSVDILLRDLTTELRKY